MTNIVSILNWSPKYKILCEHRVAGRSDELAGHDRPVQNAGDGLAPAVVGERFGKRHSCSF
jgi:hypothetical protein